MRKVATFLLLSSLLSLTGCGVEPQGSVPQPVTVMKQGSWIKAGDTKDVVLDTNLLRANIYVIFDCSTSMGGYKVEEAKKAINQFGQSIPAEMGLGLTIFDGAGPSERIPLGIDNRPQFYKVVNSAEVGDGTPLSSAMQIGYDALRAQAKRQLGYGEYHLVVVTDGEANPGYDPGNLVNTITYESPVIIHTIGFHIGTRHSLNQPGRTIYKDAQSPKDLAEGLDSVLAESDKF